MSPAIRTGCVQSDLTSRRLCQGMTAMRIELPAVQHPLKGRSRSTPADPSFTQAVIGTKMEVRQRSALRDPFPKAGPTTISRLLRACRSAATCALRTVVCAAQPTGINTERAKYSCIDTTPRFLFSGRSSVLITLTEGCRSAQTHRGNE